MSHPHLLSTVTAGVIVDVVTTRPSFFPAMVKLHRFGRYPLHCATAEPTSPARELSLRYEDST
jgi:hypothetical protein